MVCLSIGLQSTCGGVLVARVLSRFLPRALPSVRSRSACFSITLADGGGDAEVLDGTRAGVTVSTRARRFRGRPLPLRMSVAGGGSLTGLLLSSSSSTLIFL